MVIAVSALLLFSSCGTHTGNGAYVGGYFGSILGSAIGGLSDGARGSDIGTIVGMAGGAIVGAAIGSAKDAEEREEMREHYERVQEIKAQEQAVKQREITMQGGTESGFDPTNSGDDRLYDSEGGYDANKKATEEPRLIIPDASVSGQVMGEGGLGEVLDIRNARITDENEDHVLSSGELGYITFDIVNVSNDTIFDIQPSVVQTSDNLRIYISPNMHVELLEPGKIIRYTAMVRAGKVKSGMATFGLSVWQGNRVVSKVTELTMVTRR